MQPPSTRQGAFGARSAAQTAPTIGDRLIGGGRRLGVVLGRLGERERRRRTTPGYTNGDVASATPTGCSDPNVDPGVEPACPSRTGRGARTTCSSTTTSRSTTSPTTRPGTPATAAHLQDEVEFENLAQSSTTKDCNLKQVSFVKPIGEENEHPGYASEPNGSDHLVNLLQTIESSECAKDTMVVVTYDEFGGQWDHVSPPGQGNDNGPHDVWGPGTRIPALIIAPHLKGQLRRRQRPSTTRRRSSPRSSTARASRRSARATRR